MTKYVCDINPDGDADLRYVGLFDTKADALHRAAEEWRDWGEAGLPCLEADLYESGDSSNAHWAGRTAAACVRIAMLLEDALAGNTEDDSAVEQVFASGGHKAANGYEVAFYAVESPSEILGEYTEDEVVV